MKKYLVSLDLITTTLALDEISQIIGRNPSATSHDKGSPRLNKKWNETIWRLDSEAESDDILTHVVYFRDHFPWGVIRSSHKLTSSTKILLNIAIMFDTAYCSFYLPENVTVLLVELGLAVSVICYPCDFSSKKVCEKPSKGR